MKKPRNKELVEDDRWKQKGGAHKCPIPHPTVCPDCDGLGYVAIHSYHNECWKCEGTGEVWE